MEGEFTNEELCRLLVTTNFTERDGSGTVAMGLFDSTSCGLRVKESRYSHEPVGEGMRRTDAVLRAADLAASCLRGALPAER